MSTLHVRGTNGAKVVLVLSELYHREGRNQGRVCEVCGVRWTIQIDDKGGYHVWRNGVQADSAILDWTDNNG
jgi:ribosome maturation factor RimP